MKLEIFMLQEKHSPNVYQVPDDTPVGDDVLKIELFSGIDANRIPHISPNNINSYKVTFVDGTVHVVNAMDYEAYWRPVLDFDPNIVNGDSNPGDSQHG